MNHPELASRLFLLLLTGLKDEDKYVRTASASSLGQVARADFKLIDQVLQALLDALEDTSFDVQSAAASSLGEIARLDPNVRDRVFRLLIDHNEPVRIGARPSLVKLLFDLAEEEKKNRRDPIQFLFDHLEGRHSLMPDGDANTHAIYRDVIIGAMAQWLVSDKPEAKATRIELKRKLEQMRDGDKQLHLRIAAWNVFVEAAELRANRRDEEN
jgi:hypothetical protein